MKEGEFNLEYFIINKDSLISIVFWYFSYIPPQFYFGDGYRRQKYIAHIKRTENGAWHLIYINSDGAGFQKGMGLTLLQGISVWPVQV